MFIILILAFNVYFRAYNNYLRVYTPCVYNSNTLCLILFMWVYNPLGLLVPCVYDKNLFSLLI